MVPLKLIIWTDETSNNCIVLDDIDLVRVKGVIDPTAVAVRQSLPARVLCSYHPGIRCSSLKHR
jgi:hypothetical protein